MGFGVRDGLSNPLQGTGLPELHLEGIDGPSAAALIDATSPGLLPRIRSRVLEYAGGNPLALIELPSVVGIEITNAARPFRLTERLERAFEERVSGLPAPVRTLLLLAAINPEGSLAEIMKAAALVTGSSPSVAAFQPAEEGRLIFIDGQTVRFRHPLLRSAVYQVAAEEERRQAHRALAEVLGNDLDRRAWHQAAAAIGPDESSALDLVAAADNAEGRGAIAVAEAALERAAALSDDPRLRAARLLKAVRLAFQMGHREALSERLLPAVNPLDLDPPHRVLFAWIQEVFGPTWSGAERVGSFLEAADEAAASGESRLALQLHMEFSLRLWWSNPDRETRSRVLASLDRLDVSPDDPTLISCLALAGPVERGPEALERVRRLLSVPQADVMVLHDLALAAHALGAFDLSNRIYSLVIPRTRQQARPAVMAQALTAQAWTALHLGDIRLGLPVAHEGVGLSLESAQPRFAEAARLAEATLTGLRGEFERAEALAAEAESVLLPMRANPLLALVEVARGRNALIRGDFPSAYEHLKRIADPNDVAYHMYVRFWIAADLVEAAFHSGHESEAREAVATLEPLAAQSRSPVLEIGLRFARALIAADDEAEALFEAAITEDTSLPIMVARSQLAYGLWLRRQRRIAESRGPLRAAREAFEAIGATPLVERARRELRASGENSPRHRARASDRLTPQELQIAQMAADGMSNRDIGQSLFLSHRTVGFHLYRLFPKLGVTTRSQLRGALGSEQLSA
jgi:DNA-binding CsgD family transcriptional regulator